LANNAILQNNYINSTVSGGGVTVNSGTFNMTGGEIRQNTVLGNGSAFGGGAVRMNDGTGTFSGGIIENNTVNYAGGSWGGGGGVFVADGTFTMSGAAVIRTNRVPNGGGGGVAITGGTFNMQEGSIHSNTSHHSGNVMAGGGVFMAGGTFDMSGGVIIGNSATHDGGVSNGGGVFLQSGSGRLNMSGTARIDQNNDVYLASGAFIWITGTLSQSQAAKITPYSYNMGMPVLMGSGVGTNHNKFTLSSPGWTIDPLGRLIP
jgi:hypothetical protein